MRRRSTSAGFTLFEMAVTMAIIGGLLGIGIISLEQVGGADLKHSARRLAGTIRALRDEAALQAATVRLVLDLDESTYVAEITEDPFGLFPAKQAIDDGVATESDEERTDREEREEWQQEQEELSASSIEMTPQTAAFSDAFGELGSLFSSFELERVDRLKPPEFRPLEGRMKGEQELPGDVIIDSFWAQHQEDEADKGTAYLYFFPSGLTESAVIYLDDGDGEIMSLTVQPLTGEVRIEEGRVELPEEEEEEA